MDPSLAGLNAAQHAAVTSPSSILQVLAPPGSGKTKTLTSRVAYLLSHHNYKPWNILCLTFTIKSAKEMKERIAKLIGNGIETRIVLGTFHSVCRRYLASYGHLIGIRKGFGIADSSDSLSIVKRIIKRMNFKIDPMQARSRISRSKSRGISCMDIAKEEGKKKSIDEQEFHLVFEAFESQLEQSNLLDYDDLLLRCVELLEKHPECVSNIEAVLIDEFQDTNLVQFDLMRLLASKNKRVTTVGDPDQSIYGWRAAEVKNLGRMQDLYSDTMIIHLEDNYRSSGAIILSAREVIEQDDARIVRPLLATHCPGTAPVLRRVPTAEAEAQWIVSEIERVAALTGRLLTYSDYAILVRSASLTRHIESTLGKAGIPYRMVGGQRFFDRLEIKILLDYLRVVSQPKSNDALARIINVPPRGIGPATVKTLLETAETSSIALWDLIRSIFWGGKAPKVNVSKRAEKGLRNLMIILLSSMKKLLDVTEPHSPAMLLEYITKKLDFEEYLKKTHEQDHDARWANVEELSTQASDYQLEDPNAMTQSTTDLETLPAIDGIQQTQSSPAEDALSKFLANVALATEIQREEESDDQLVTPQHRVTISTMHAAKGLEWPVVFVPSAYAGLIPHSRAEDTDEERRLLYVAMTRAQALLYISCPTKNSQREETTLSPFLSSKKIGHFFTNQGPTLGFSSVQDIARILRRECPTEAALLNSCKSAPSLEDNKWPLDGTEIHDPKDFKWNRLPHANSMREHTFPPSKRRKLHDDDVQDSDGSFEGFVCLPLAASRRVGITTMEMPSSFSYVSGFTSAATQLRAAQSEESSYRSKRSRAGNDNNSDKESPKKIKPEKRLQGQSTLSNFIAKRPAGKEAPIPTVPRISEKVPNTSTELQETNPSKTASTSFTVQIPALRNTTPKLDSPPRKPLSSIPQSLSTHRLQNRPTGRPHPPPRTDEQPTKDYVFLSSSPPQPTTINDFENDAVKEEETMTPLSYTNIIKPAKTFHTTTIAQLQSSNNGSRRTLGVKRSMNGWAARGNKMFAVPRGGGGRG